MMQEIIKLIIHEAQTMEGREMDYKLNQVLSEIEIIISSMARDLGAISKLHVPDDKKEAMSALVLTSHRSS